MRRVRKKVYLEREVSWMYFNHRVLQEAQDARVPLLERLAFLGIYSNNMDEFFRVRVALLNRPHTRDLHTRSRSRKEDVAVLAQINDLYKKYALEFEQTFAALKKELEQYNIYIVAGKDIDQEQREEINRLFIHKLSPYLHPRLFLRNSNFKDLDDESVYLAVRLLQRGGRKEYALLEIPVQRFGRFVRLQDGEDKARKTFMFLDDVIRICLPFIFAGQPVTDYDAYAFKLTKDAGIDIDLSLEGALNKVDKAVKNRRWGQPVRFIYDRDMPPDLLKQIRKNFNFGETDNVIAGSCYHNLKDLMAFPQCGAGQLKYPEWQALCVPELMGLESVIEVIRRQDILLHYPYHSFSNFVRLLREAAIHRDVHTLKITLYRLARHSVVAESLICAARNGKKVTVVIELLARFDEASNIYWTKKMQDAGITVILGIEGLKIHAKLTLIKGKAINIACINTGNFHEGNATTYTDLSLMTANRNIVKEVETVFSFIQKPYLNVSFKKLLVAPLTLREGIKELINVEIRNARRGKEAFIKGKLNHLIDKDIIDKLYEASTAGVKIDLLVRGSCSLVTGIEGLSSNISVKGIIDRFLEHSRIFIFANAGKPKYFIGSADWAYRNFDTRVEVIVPVLDERLQAELDIIVDYGLRDNQKARLVDGSGDNIILSEGAEFRSQKELFDHYKQVCTDEGSLLCRH
ncbi:MAG: RNA degradosome polyphosphate kinase [Tannerellaceae bacterium]|jgi:polyphosphate kinase|nr:RNA degradosome polyphosphate kinase [Tannerellaceae bacterium]